MYVCVYIFIYTHTVCIDSSSFVSLERCVAGFWTGWSVQRQCLVFSLVNWVASFVIAPNWFVEEDKTRQFHRELGNNLWHVVY